MREGRREVGERGVAATPPALANSGGQYQAIVVVGVLADEVDAAGRAHQRCVAKALLKKGGNDSSKHEQLKEG